MLPRRIASVRYNNDFKTRALIPDPWTVRPFDRRAPIAIQRLSFCHVACGYKTLWDFSPTPEMILKPSGLNNPTVYKGMTLPI